MLCCVVGVGRVRATSSARFAKTWSHGISTRPSPRRSLSSLGQCRSFQFHLTISYSEDTSSTSLRNPFNDIDQFPLFTEGQDLFKEWFK